MNDCFYFENSSDVNHRFSHFFYLWLRQKAVFFLLCLFCGLGLSFVVVAGAGSTKPDTLEWTQVRGLAQDISIGANGDVFAAGTGDEVWRWRRESSGWSRRSGAIQRVAVNPKGEHWGLAAGGEIYRMNGLWWQQVDGQARDIAIGADGTVIIINLDNTLSRWDRFSGRWRSMTGSGQRIAVDPKGNPWVVKADRTLARFNKGDWQAIPGQANDIAVAPDGSVYIIDDDAVSRWDEPNTLWIKQVGTEGGIALAAGPGGKLWYLDSGGAIYASSLFSLQKESESEETAAPAIASAEDGKESAEQANEDILTIRRRNSAANDPASITNTEPLVFTRVKGVAIDLAIGAEGSIYSLSSDSSISRWSNRRSRFQNFPGTLIRLAVGPDGFPLGINTDRDIFRHDGDDWKNIKGKAEDIAVGADGTIIISDTEQRLFKLNSGMTRFERIPGKGDMLAVAPDGTPWTILKDGSIFRCDGNPCTRLRRTARDIAIGPDGSVFMVSSNNRLFIFDERKDDWRRILTSKTPIAVGVGPQGRPWFVDIRNEIYASTFFQRDEGNDLIVARSTNKPTIVTSPFLPSPTSTFTFTKNFNFQTIPVPAAVTTNIGIGLDGSVFILTDGPVLRYREKNRTFEQIFFPALPPDAISSDVEGRVWIIDTAQAQRQKKKDGTSFTSFSFPNTPTSQTTDIALGGDGSVFAVWRDGDLYKLNTLTNRFEKFINTGDYSKVAVTIDGRPWIIENTTQLVKEYDGVKFVKPGNQTQTAVDIAIGAGGTVFIVDPVKNIKRWNATNQRFDDVNDQATNVAVEPDGRPWILETDVTVDAFRAR